MDILMIKKSGVFRPSVRKSRGIRPVEDAPMELECY